MPMPMPMRPLRTAPLSSAPLSALRPPRLIDLLLYPFSSLTRLQLLLLAPCLAPSTHTHTCLPSFAPFLHPI